MKYKCILIDHDDTVAPTSEYIHFPSFKNSLEKLGFKEVITFEEYINYSYDPGFENLMTDILKLNEEKIKFIFDEWNKNTIGQIGIFYEEIKNFLIEFIQKDGIIGVVTHSRKDRIEKDYMYNLKFIPEDIYSWELGKDMRKPSIYPIENIKQKYGLSNEEILVIDDLKPGLIMAKNGKVDFLWAGWAYKNPCFLNEMIKNSTYFATNFYDFEKIVKEKLL